MITDKERLITLPSDEEVERGVKRFARQVRDHYGSRLVGLYLYGTRSRGPDDDGDESDESDAAVVAVLAGEFDFWRELCALSDLSYDELIDHDIFIDAKPVVLSAWNDPATTADPSWNRPARREGTRATKPKRSWPPCETSSPPQKSS
jgi:hypothetical protein